MPQNSFRFSACGVIHANSPDGYCLHSCWSRSGGTVPAFCVTIRDYAHKGLSPSRCAQFHLKSWPPAQATTFSKPPEHLAIKALQDGTIPSQRQAALIYNVPRTTFLRRESSTESLQSAKSATAKFGKCCGPSGWPTQR